jgi:hypothetical protein
MTEKAETHRPARLSPAGYVAQRMDQDFNGYGHWLLTYYDDTTDLLVMHALSDEDVADWLPLSLVPKRSE